MHLRTAQETDAARAAMAQWQAVPADAVATCRTPAPALPVMPYRRPLSASALKTFIECERKWYYRYLCNVIEDPGSIAGTYGTAFHAALEYLHEEYTRPQPDQAAAMLQRLCELLRDSFRKHAAGLGTALEAELHLRRALRTAEKYVSWIVKMGASEPFTIVGNETTAPLDINGHTFTGYIDRLDKRDRDGTISVIDYKTGSIAESAAEYRDDVAAFREFQLPLYYWSRTAQGETVGRLSLIPLKDPLKEIMPVEVEIVPGIGTASGTATRGTIGMFELERARTRMGEMATVLTEQTLEHFAVTDDPDACVYCAYRAACRKRPHRQEDAFGR